MSFIRGCPKLNVVNKPKISILRFSLCIWKAIYSEYRAYRKKWMNMTWQMLVVTVNRAQKSHQYRTVLQPPASIDSYIYSICLRFPRYRIVRAFMHITQKIFTKSPLWWWATTRKTSIVIIVINNIDNKKIWGKCHAKMYIVFCTRALGFKR